MKAWILAAALIASPTLAQRPAGGTIGTARAIVAQMHVERTLDPMLEQLMPLMSRNVLAAMDTAKDLPTTIKARLANPEGRKQVGAIIGQEFMVAFRTRYPDIEAAAAEEYRNAFTEDELRAVLAFYQSPAGAKFVAIQPQLQKTLSEQGRAIGREAGMTAFPKIQARLAALDASSGK